MPEVDFDKASKLLNLIAQVANIMPRATWLLRAASEELKKMEEEFLEAEEAEKPDWTPPQPDVRRETPQTQVPIYPRGTVTERPSLDPMPRPPFTKDPING